jgi:CRISPR system Cascade subunit CasE
MTMFLSLVKLSRAQNIQALAHVLQPDHAPKRQAIAHNLIWTLFADTPERTRDFLWREEKDGHFLVLSHRPPIQTDIWQPHLIKDFAPALIAGDILEFSLRVNATRKKRGMKNHVDFVMDALHAIPQAQRAVKRMEIAQEQSAAWLAGQGSKAGFDLLASQCEDYSAHALDSYRGPRKGQPQFGICDITGTLRITDPAAFLAQISAGFGRAKAFGCGLMLIRRRG